MKKKNQTYKKKKVEANPEVSRYLEISIPENKENLWIQILDKTKAILKKIHTKGKKKITIMLIPHSESSIINLHLNFYILGFGFIFILFLTLISTFIIINRNSQNLQYYHLGVTTSNFPQQASKLAEEIIPMHQTILEFAETITRIHNNLRIASENGKGGIVNEYTFTQVENLNTLIEQCKEKKNECDQSTIEKILKISLNISELDNVILSDSNKKIEEILSEIKSENKKAFFSIIPSGFPVKGFIKNNYKTKVILERGNNYPLRGVEILTLPNSPVKATANGKVVEINYHPTFGLYIWIEHISGIQTFYAHLGEVEVNLHQEVKRGDIIGYTGRTGNINNNILYYEVHIGTLAFNPHILMNDIQSLWLNL
ncbi:MAG: M23 family metallopeptidase [Leptonema sp. (in: bacteria)]